MSKKPKRFIDPNDIFPKKGGKNWWDMKGGILGGRKSGKSRKRQNASISGAGKPDKGVPNIAASGRADSGVPDITGRSRDRSKGGVPDIGGAGKASKNERRLPQIGAAGSASGDAPSLGSKNKRQKERIPSIGSLSKRTDQDKKAAVLGGDADVPDIGAAGPGRSGKPSKRRGIRGAARNIAAYFGFRSLSETEETELMFYARRVMQAGHPLSLREFQRIRANMMLGKLDREALWKTPTGQAIERRYGRRGRDLDLPEADRPKRGFVREDPEVKDQGVAPSSRSEKEK